MNNKSEESKILNEVAHRDGMTVPPGYFADFGRRMEAMLPEQSFVSVPAEVSRTLWQRVRPYVYMAAMFAGIWCMMKMFSLMAGDESATPFADNAVLAEAVSDDTFINDFYINDVDEEQLMDDLYNSGYNPEI